MWSNFGQTCVTQVLNCDPISDQNTVCETLYLCPYQQQTMPNLRSVGDTITILQAKICQNLFYFLYVDKNSSKRQVTIYFLLKGYYTIPTTPTPWP